VKISSFPILKAIIASGAENYIYDVVVFLGTAARNLFTKKHLQSHRPGKRFEFGAESLELRVQTHSAEPKQEMTGDGIALLHV
jgi:peroxiredoxin family protein